MNNLNSTLENILKEAIASAHNGYFERIATNGSAEQEHLERLIQLGFMRRVSDWNLCTYNGEFANKARFFLLSPAYTYDEDKAIAQPSATQNSSNVNITVKGIGNSPKITAQQNTQNSSQDINIEQKQSSIIEKFFGWIKNIFGCG